MPKRMLIDATHPEETRVAIVDGNRLEEFDFEIALKKQLKGNIYLAKITRIEPSLQAAFVEYGGNRHGFLPFAEVHPDYYRIPVADRQALIAASEQLAAEQEAREAAEEEAAAAAERAALRQAPGTEENGDRPVALAIDHDAISSEPLAEFDDERARPTPTEATNEGLVENRSETADEDEDEVDGPRPSFTPEAGAAFADALGFADTEEDGDDERSRPTEPLPTDRDREAHDHDHDHDDHDHDDHDHDDHDHEHADEAHDGDDDDHPDERAADESDESEDAEEPFNETGEAEAANADASDEPGAPNVSFGSAIVPEGEAPPLVEAPGGRDGERRERRGGRRERFRGRGRGGRDRDRGDRNERGDRGERGERSERGERGDRSERGERGPRYDAREGRVYLPRYKIQEVLKRRQIMLVQVSKEERGNKGAAVTTYLSLPGRYCVLMPNSPHGGGISRKIANPKDRRRMKELLAELDVPKGMSVIIRTAGLERSKAEIKRDLDYLLRLWENIRELTLQSTAPALIYEEGNLVKRAIRDLYDRNIDEVLVAGDEGYKTAKTFMRMLIPSHSKRVQQYRDPIPLFHRYKVEPQIDAMYNPVVQLKSGGYLVINQTEALVAVDVNSGKSTKERNIEETALRTNLEAADEVARQMRLRDLGGLVVVDFIDMEDGRNDAAVERRLKDAIKQDRARIQIGRISGFGLLELSRQRLRPSLMETSFEVCDHCGGTGMVRSVSSSALSVLRAIEDEAILQRAAKLIVTVPTRIALFLLNTKREALAAIEQRYYLQISFATDDTLVTPVYRIDRIKRETLRDDPMPIAITAHPTPVLTADLDDDFEDEIEESEEDESDEEAEPQPARARERDRDEESRGEGESGEGDDRRRGRRRRRRRGRNRREDEREESRDRGEEGAGAPLAADDEDGEPDGEGDSDSAARSDDEGGGERDGGDGDGGDARRRRGRRGGRRRRRGGREREPGGDTRAGSETPAWQNAEAEETPMPSYERDVERGTDAGVGHAPLEHAPADTGPIETPRDDDAPAANEPVELPVGVGSAPEPEPEPSGPKRTGWWRRMMS
jgi:ribonuclease E